MFLATIDLGAIKLTSGSNAALFDNELALNVKPGTIRQLAKSPSLSRSHILLAVPKSAIKHG